MASHAHVMQQVREPFVATAPPHSPLTVSVVVPTRNEAGNIQALIERVERALHQVPFEVVFVDDSDDDTVAMIESIQERVPCPIRVIHRPASERGDGLGGAVVLGMLVARAPLVCVMDADLQHPPELLPQLLAQATRTGADVVVASRYCAQGDTGEFGRMRSSVSYTTTAAAHVLFPRRLKGVSDPMSGFFLVRKAAINLDQLRPRGFKILLDVLVRTPGLRVAEVPFQFGKRYAGESKASFREGMRYLALLWHLRSGGKVGRFMSFLLVGVSGLIVNLLLHAFITDVVGINYLLAAVLATQGSTLWNFSLTEGWVFRDRQGRQGRLMRFVLFLCVNNAALLLRGPIIYVFTAQVGLHYLWSNFISLVVLTVVRYALADNLIWKGATVNNARSAYTYNIHDIISVSSDVGLPELERFMVDHHIEQPTIRVRIGKVRSSKAHASATNGSAERRTTYNEGLGGLGFAAEITIGDTVDVVASSLLQYSPHVLYTNVVEPILRWAFVERGYALVHGACIAYGDQAYLVTARTDTGKTTTMLRVLDRQRRASDNVTFLSDDLTLVARDGRVFTYPKPLTISHHTVRAINSALLSRRERVVLPFQSRIHSRSGRRFAFLLTQTKLPVATINTIVQLLVPPPKYHVQRLVPHVKVAHQAKLAGMFIIERADDGDVPLSEAEAFDTLMRNCEDAYGFPPYPTIRSFLHTANNIDLQQIERDIVAQALAGHPTMLLRSTKLDWAQRILMLLNATPARREDPAPTEVGLDHGAADPVLAGFSAG